MSRIDAQGAGTFEFPKGLLHLEYTLSNGQMFRWRQTPDGWWDAVTGDRMIRIRKVDDPASEVDRFEFFTFPGEPDLTFVEQFFRFDVVLDKLYSSWLEADPYLGSLAERFKGLRIVKQVPEECLLSFMCSTANFIPRIMKAIPVHAPEKAVPAAPKPSAGSTPSKKTIPVIDRKRINKNG